MSSADRTTTADIDQLELLLLPDAGRSAPVTSVRLTDKQAPASIVDLAGYETAEAERQRVLTVDVEHAMATTEEAGMPRPAARGSRDLLKAVPLLLAAGAVLAVYLGLPLTLASRPVLDALPNALLFSAAVIVLGIVGVVTVLKRTAAAPITADAPAAAAALEPYPSADADAGAPHAAGVRARRPSGRLLLGAAAALIAVLAVRTAPAQQLAALAEIDGKVRYGVHPQWAKDDSQHDTERMGSSRRSSASSSASRMTPRSPRSWTLRLSRSAMPTPRCC